ncbi:thiamine pyrophosphate-binding protein [Prauserella cavernicola]|uniref:Thiamine pyrophosphate-binding protein n=1 Tax=Prauserella cavernicola TaxID=2800127 RepID=A0A934R1M1_9PSEU|nr:thiamine pyrophosphate-binding protein [Prauserella cavernicola]MBK1789173.1 thiamine pyrophosphate-binding protein [Prauserella cavernicola]
MSRSGAEVIVEHLVRENVPYVVGLCGHGDLGLLDALHDRQDEIATISMHHESAAGFVADAYYRIRHRPLATFTSCGPGSANLPVALGSALMDDSAFLAITGNVATSQFSRGPFQESGRHFQADFPSVVKPYVKRSFQATRPEQLPVMLRQAFDTMRGGRPGPVHLDVPLDVFVERTDADTSGWAGTTAARTGAAAEQVDAVLELLAESERVVIVAGSGVETDEARAELAAFAELVQAPVVTSPLGKPALPSGHALALGAAGRNGTLQANRATRNADLVLAFGTRFDDRSTSSWLPGYTYSFPKSRLVHVHVDPLEIGRNFPPTVGIPASPREVLRQLAAAVPRQVPPSRHAWLDRTARWRREWEAHVAPHRSSDAVPIRPERVLADLRGVLPADAILVSDVGVHHNWIVQEWPVEHGTLLQSWGFASMGFGPAGVLGAHLAAPERAAVAVVGDGGFLMLPSVVATAVQYAIPAVWLVWNNGGYMSIRDQQHAYFGADRELATTFRIAATGEPHRTDFAAMARSMGGEGITVTHPADLGPALETALASPAPVVVDVRVDDAVHPPAVATWALPPLPHPEPAFGWPDY